MGGLGNVFITGGTGSFGNRMVEVLKQSGMANSITVMSRDEYKHDVMERVHKDVRYIVGDVRNIDSVRQAMRGADYVFHAAALKQVPRCERYPMEAVHTNILGTSNVLQAAAESVSVERLVCLSTDKAVEPVNTMGLSKAMGEKLMVYWNSIADGKKFMAVRYGNVIGSRGSVVPLFRQQVEAGKELTVTSETMTRFMLTLTQAIDFIIAASLTGDGGEIFVPKLPALSIMTLAKIMAQGRVGVRVIGTRPGEKEHESLVGEAESFRCTDAVVNPWYVIRPEPSENPVGFSICSKDFVCASDKYWEDLLISEGWIR